MRLGRGRGERPLSLQRPRRGPRASAASGQHHRLFFMMLAHRTRLLGATSAAHTAVSRCEYVRKVLALCCAGEPVTVDIVARAALGVRLHRFMHVFGDVLASLELAPARRNTCAALALKPWALRLGVLALRGTLKQTTRLDSVEDVRCVVPQLVHATRCQSLRASWPQARNDIPRSVVGA